MPQEEKKHISTTTGLLIILAAAVIIGGGAIAYFFVASPTSWDYMGNRTSVHKNSNKNTNTNNIATSSVIAPEKVAENFYNYDLGLINSNGQADSHGVFQNTTQPYKLRTGFSDYLTATLISNLESKYNSSANNLEPILCAQDIPDKITYDVAKITNNTATSVVDMQFTPVNKVILGYVKDGNNWKINTITCP